MDHIVAAHFILKEDHVFVYLINPRRNNSFLNSLIDLVH